MTRPTDIPADVWEIAAGCVPLPFALPSDETQQLVARALIAYGQRRADEATERARPRVKPLEWDEYERGGGALYADTLLGQYYATPRGEWGLRYHRRGFVSGCDSLIEGAKDAAQADYEAHIMLALVQP